MVSVRLVAVYGAPDDWVDRLRALGLKVGGDGYTATIHGDILVLPDYDGRLPVESIVESFGTERWVSASSSFAFLRRGGELGWDIEEFRREGEQVHRQRLGEGTHTLEADEVGSEPESVAMRHVNDTMGERLGLPPATRTFRLGVARGWRPPDPLEHAVPGPAVVNCTVAGEVMPLDAHVLRWLKDCLESGGVLDKSGSAPDLSRWHARLISRHGSTSAPAFAEDWFRLTHAERARESVRAGSVPAWKFAGGPAVLTAAELVVVVSQLAFAARNVPVGLREAIASLHDFLNGKIEAVIEPV
jgi:hypothetical protein